MSYLLHVLQDVVEHEAPLLQLSAEKMSRYGIFLMEYGLVGCGQRGRRIACHMLLPIQTTYKLLNISSLLPFPLSFSLFLPPFFLHLSLPCMYLFSPLTYSPHFLFLFPLSLPLPFPLPVLLPLSLHLLSPLSIHQGLYIWVGKDAPHELVQKIFGVQHFGAIPEIMVGAHQVHINTGATTESTYSLYTNVWYCIFVLITLVLL